MYPYMGDCQNYGPFLGPHYNTGPNTGPNLGDPKGTIILTIPHIPLYNDPLYALIIVASTKFLNSNPD